VGADTSAKEWSASRVGRGPGLAERNVPRRIVWRYMAGLWGLSRRSPIPWRIPPGSYWWLDGRFEPVPVRAGAVAVGRDTAAPAHLTGRSSESKSTSGREFVAARRAALWRARQRTIRSRAHPTFPAACVFFF